MKSMKSGDRTIPEPGAILVATDLSVDSDQAIVQAHERARADDKPLIVCFVIRSSVRYDPVLPGVRVEYEDDLPVVRNRALEAVRARVSRCTPRNSGDYEILIEQGLPHERIVAAAELFKVGLIVVGAHPGDGLRHALGNVSERVVRHAHRSVLIARADTARRPILVATDFSDPAMPALSAAVKEASQRGAKLTILHSLDVTIAMEGTRNRPLGGLSLGLPLEDFLAMKEKAQSRMQALLERTGLDGNVIVSEGPPAEAILRNAEEANAGMIFLGTRGRAGLARLMLGSVAETVARTAPCSVFVVRLDVDGVRERGSSQQLQEAS